MKSKDDPIGKWRSDNAIRQITAEAAKDIAKKFTQPDKPIEEQIIDRADKVVSDCCQTFIRMRNIRITPTKFSEAVEMIYKLNKEQFSQWSKEDLLVLCSFQNALITTQRLETELI